MTRPHFTTAEVAGVALVTMAGDLAATVSSAYTVDQAIRELGP